MSIKAIETQDSNSYPFGTIAKGTIAGGVLGYVAKDKLPLNSSEMDKEFEGALAIIREQSNKAKASAIETIRNIKDKTPAQDVFVKMVDAENSAIANSADKKVNRAFSMRKVLSDAKLNDKDMVELKGIIACVNEKATDMFRRCKKGFIGAVKDKRLTGLYVAAGGVLGFFGGLAATIIKSPNEA